MMQQNTAGVWGVPKLRAISSWLIVSEWGLRGLTLNAETLAAGFARLYPPCNWIPACAGMTEESVRLRRTGGLVVDSPQDEACPATPQPPPRLGVRGLNPKNEPRKEEPWLI